MCVFCGENETESIRACRDRDKKERVNQKKKSIKKEKFAGRNK
jgi:hypothetical protein